MTQTTQVTALRPGDKFVCPGSGRVEKVTTVRRTPRGVFVRTNRHDHCAMNPDRTVEVVTSAG